MLLVHIWSTYTLMLNLDCIYLSWHSTLNLAKLDGDTPDKIKFGKNVKIDCQDVLWARLTNKLLIKFYPVKCTK